MWTTYGSYNSIRKPVVGDAVKIAAYDTFCSFVGGIAIFAVVGYLKQIEFPMDESNGMEMAYIALPNAIAMTTRSPRFWIFCLFATWFIFGLDTQISYFEAVVTITYDIPWSRKIKRTYFVLFLV